MRKKFVALSLAAMLGMTPMASFAAIDESTHIVSLSQGVQLKKVNTFYEWGVQNINILEIDMNNPAVKLDLLFNKNGFSQRTKLSDMVNQDSGIVAAVNGDFFSMSTPGFSLGPMVKDGKQLSSGHYEINKYATFIMDGTNNAIMTYVYPGVSVDNQSKGTNVNVAAINKPSNNYANPVIMTREYMQNSPGASKTFFDLTEVVVENDVVKEVRFGLPSVAIPANGYVIVAGGANSYVLSAAFAAGDRVNLKTDLSIGYPNVQLAMGGGTLIVKDGQAAGITQTVSGKSQRTAIGVTRDQKILIVTVDGRKAPYIGMDEKDMQAYMLSLGVKDAMMLDGGGSTSLIADGKLQNDMTAGERSLVNGLAIKNTASKGSIASIEITPLKDVIFQGDKVELIIKGKDGAGNPIDITTPSFSVMGEGISGNFDGRHFVPTTAGSGAIVASYGGVSGRLPIEVLAKNAADSRYSSAPTGVVQSVVFADMSSGDSVMANAIKGKLQQIANQSPAVILAGSKDATFENGIASPKEAFNGAYKTSNHGSTSYISIDNRNGGIYKVTGQWDYLKGLLKTGGSNIVMVLQGSDQSGDSVDKEAFNKILQDAAKTKNIYVVYKAKSFQSRLDGRISYIGIPDLADMPKQTLADLKYLSFTENNGVLQYTFAPLF